MAADSRPRNGYLYRSAIYVGEYRNRIHPTGLVQTEATTSTKYFDEGTSLGTKGREKAFPRSLDPL